MEILYQLGLDKTFWIQLVCFLVSGFFLSVFMFRPYLRIIDARRKSTVGATDQAAHLVAQTDALILDYEGKVRRQNEKLTETFAEFKKLGAAEEERLLAEARARAQAMMAENHARIAKEIAQVQKDLETQVPALANAIATKVLGRELRA